MFENKDTANEFCFLAAICSWRSSKASALKWLLPRDCSLFMPKGGPVFRVGGGGKIFKINEKGGCFLKCSRNKGGKLLETVVSTLVLV